MGVSEATYFCWKQKYGGLGPSEPRRRRQLVGGGRFDLAAGEWTDGTTMALCLADTLVVCDGLDQADMMGRFQRWLNDGKYSVKGYCFGIGSTTCAPIERFAANGFPAAGSTANDTAGNGSQVRLAPLAIFCRGEHSLGDDLAEKQSLTTHGARECVDACRPFMA